MITGHDLRDRDVGALGKHEVMLELRPEGRQVDGARVVEARPFRIRLDDGAIVRVDPGRTPWLVDLLDRTERVDGLRNDVEALKGLIDERMGALRQPRPARRPA